MPSSTLDDLCKAYGLVSAANQAALDRFSHVANQFRATGIECLVLKGADVVSRLYGVRGARPMSDVDLLVHEVDLPAIDRLLTALGFARQIDGNPAYLSPDQELSLDLTTTIWYLSRREVAEIWSRAITRPLLGTQIRGLATEDLLIHLVAYAVVHRGHLAAPFAQDLRLLIEKESPDWPTVVSRSRQYGLAIPLSHGLGHVRRSHPAVGIPDTVFRDLAPGTWREHMLAWFLRKAVTTTPLPEVGHLLLCLTQRPGKRSTWLRQTLWPSRTFLSYRYGRNGLCAPVKTRILRLSHLAVAALLLGGRLIGRVTTAQEPVR
jgi:hypothetical protein